MTTAARVVSTATAVDPDGLRTVNERRSLLVDQFGRLITNSSTTGVAAGTPAGGTEVAAGARVEAVYDVNGRQLAPPVALSGVEQALIGSAGSPVVATAAWQSSAVISLDSGSWRRMRLLLDLDAATIGNVVNFIVLGAFTAVAPASAADSWYALGTTDGTWTSTALTGTVFAGSNFTITPNWFAAGVRGSVFSTPAVSATTDELRIAFPAIDVTGVRHVMVQFAEQTALATLASVIVRYSLSL